MNKFLILLCLISANFILSPMVQAAPKDFLYQQLQRKQEYQRQIKKFGIDPHISSGSLIQKLNHFDTNDGRTFRQRFWMRSYSKDVSESAPVILNICGEGECGANYVGGGAAAEHAKILGANLVALEHRYYGQSQPFPNLKTENLKYLTIEQALQDLLFFKSHVQKMGYRGPWIVIGGSYAGSLAAYLRQKYPTDFMGALSSSGPVRADLDFSEYDRHVALQAGEVCLQKIQSNVAAIEQKMMNPDSADQIKKKFSAQELNREDDFLYLIADTAAAAIQYGMRDQFCNYMDQGIDGYARATEMVSKTFGNLVNLSAQAAESTDLAVGAIGMRQWFYQSCTQYGYWQNAWGDSALSARSKKINAQYHSEICERLFGIKVPANVEKTNEDFYQPLLDTSTSRILFTNGDEDPWINLSVAPDNNNISNPNTKYFVIRDAAHCDDLGLKPNSQEARVLFRNLASYWLNIKPPNLLK